MFRLTRVSRTVVSLAAIASASALGGCAGGAEAEDDRPSVVTSFYPLQYVAQRIVGGHARVANLTPPGAEPHDLELTVEQTAEVADADLVLHHSGLQPAVAEAVDQTGPEPALDVAALGGGPSDGAEESPDPHFWLYTTRMAEVARKVTNQMTRVDPAHANDYRENFERLRTDLERLDRDYRAGLADCARRTIVVSHDAFGYLTRYALRVEPINGLSPGAEPSPGRVAELQELIRDKGITTVFFEPLASPDLARTIASDLGIRTAVLDPIEGSSTGLHVDPRAADYLSLMRANLAALRKANQCR